MTQSVIVFIAYECYDDGCSIHRYPVKVFDSEEKALLWTEELLSTGDPNEWRAYEEFEIE